MLRRVMSLLLAAIMVISMMAGCGSSDLITDEGATDTAATDTAKTDSGDAKTEDTAKEEPAKEETAAETETATEEEAPPAFEAAEGDVIPGYYNLADFESQTGKKLDAFNEAPMLADKVAKGELPPVAERLPSNPAVFRTLDTVGEYGGTLRFTSINNDQDWHLRHINAANLIEQRPDPAWDVVSTVFGVDKQPGILEDYSMSPDGLKFEATIRKGLKWSDGTPVTTKDVEFKINDVLLNTTLYPVPPNWLMWGNGKTQFKVIDDYSFEFTFAAPYGSFVEAEITLWPGTYQRLLLPAHWLSKAHIDYGDEAEILERMKIDGYNNISEWKEWFGKKTGLFGCDNTKMDSTGIVPTLNPWMIVEDLGDANYRLERNPYFYMVDQEGNQLPYIDGMKRSFVANEEVDNMQIISGQVDLSCMTLSVENFPLYKENEDKGNYSALPLPAWQDQIFLTGFNANAGIQPPKLTSITESATKELPEDASYDPELADIYGDVRFRRAMSVALDRKVFNDTLFLGLGRPAQVAPRPGTPFYKEGMEESWSQYDPELAKQLLDEMGLKDVNGDGWREKPSGAPFKIRYDYFVITGASTPGSELCKRYWEDVGVQVELKLVDTSYWWENLQPNNLNEATTWWLAGSGANLLQHWFLGPSMLVPLWNRYYQYKLADNISTEDWEQQILPYVPEWQREMQDLKRELLSEPNEAKRIEIGTRMWELQAEWLPIIGTVTEARSPLIVSKDMGNVEFAEEKGFNYISVMEWSECFYFKTPERRK